jgi:signal transduction histidine kinase/CheY-like chemotaxis protein
VDRSAIETIFTDFLHQYPNISQVRWLDATGMERARVNQTFSAGGERTIASAGMLQDKSQRDYFRQAMEPGDVDFFISKIDLNREFGEIELPPQPTLRIALRTRDQLNMRSGVLVLNFNLSGLILGLPLPGQPGLVSIDLLDGVSGKVYSSMYNPGLAWAHELRDPPIYYGDIYPERFKRIKTVLSGNTDPGGNGSELIMMAAPNMKVTDGSLIAYIFMAPEFLAAQRRNVLVETGSAVAVAWLFGSLLLIRIFRMETRNARTMDEVRALAAAKSQFLANMSHEIRTPISGMMGMLDLLVVDIKEPAQRDRLEFIRQCTRNLRRVIDDILDVSKLQGGRVMLENKPFEPARTIDTTVSLYAIEAQQNGTALNGIVPEALNNIAVEGDEHRLSQVLNNLVSNAVKFTEQGQVAVEMEELRRSDTDTTLRFSVRDSGIGMSSEILEILGQPFVQADVTTTRDFGGTGLGLSICKSLLALMGSELNIISEPGKGSTFSFDLSFTLVKPETSGVVVGHRVDESTAELAPDSATPSADENEEATREALMQQLARSVAEHGPPRVLVAEDSFAMQVLIGEIFKSFSIPAQFADNGKLALERLAEQPFDLVFMDLQMPVMGGIEATGLIRQKWSSAQLPVIVLSAVTQDDEIARALAAGGDKCLAKPIDIEELLATLLNYWHPKTA